MFKTWEGLPRKDYYQLLKITRHGLDNGHVSEDYMKGQKKAKKLGKNNLVDQDLPF